MWKFDDNISSVYTEHVLNHIPNYSLILDLTCEIAEDFLEKNSYICDFGSANGNTLVRLENKGFKNLYGIENSTDMIKNSPNRFSITKSFPDIKFDFVISNWALHFNKDKESILNNISDHLKKDGIFLLSEKVSLEKYAINKYHNWKKSNGVTHEEIIKKEKMLVDSMFIDDVSWYLEKLKSVGFNNIEIINSHWCFCTFLCRRS